MTKYILVGGYPSKASDSGKSFCEELIRGFEKPVKLLDCLFARPPESWEKTFSDDKEFFANHLPAGSVEMKLASPSAFISSVTVGEISLEETLVKISRICLARVRGSSLYWSLG